jgi:glutamate synthase domain-containing protein 3
MKWAPTARKRRTTASTRLSTTPMLLKLCKPAIERGEKVRAELPIINVNRVVGTITGSELTRKHGGAGPAGRHDPPEVQGQRRTIVGSVLPARNDLRT